MVIDQNNYSYKALLALQLIICDTQARRRIWQEPWKKGIMLLLNLSIYKKEIFLMNIIIIRQAPIYVH